MQLSEYDLQTYAPPSSRHSNSEERIGRSTRDEDAEAIFPREEEHVYSVTRRRYQARDDMATILSKFPDYGDWESVTRKPFYQSQLPLIGRWVRGTVLDIGSNVGRFSALSHSTVSLDIDKRWLIRGI